MIKFGNHFKTASLSFYILPRPVMSSGSLCLYPCCLPVMSSLSLLSVMSSDRSESRHLPHSPQRYTIPRKRIANIIYSPHTRNNSDKFRKIFFLYRKMGEIRDIFLQTPDCCRKISAFFCNDAGNQGNSSEICHCHTNSRQFFRDDDKEYDICSKSGKITWQ